MLLWSLCLAQALVAALGASGVESGTSSHIILKENVASHHKNMNKVANFATAKKSQSTPNVEIQKFFRQYEDYFGVQGHEMRVKRESRDAGSKVTNYVHEQYIDGYKVYGGEVVVSLGNENKVLAAHGHPLPSSHVDKSLSRHIIVSPEDARHSVVNHLNALPPLEGEKGKRKYICTEISLPASTVWYRSKVHTGREGTVSLVHYLSGHCLVASAGGDVRVPLDAFVDTQTGDMVQFIDKRGMFLSTSARDALATLKKSTVSSSLRGHSQHKPEAKQSSKHRKLDLYSELTVKVYDTRMDTAGNPFGCCNGDLLFDEDLASSPPSDASILNAVNYTADFTRMMRALSNQEFKTFAIEDIPLKASVNYPDVNAFFDGSDITLGTGLEVDDVIAHEWAHGYTSFSSDLQYYAMPGAMNEAFSDIFGESYDILNDKGTVLDSSLRTADGSECTKFEHGFGGASGNDISTRWLVGEDIKPPGYPPTLSYAIRDMYVPSCFGGPDHVNSSSFVCTESDNAGVHTNSAVPNRVFAILVDGGQLSNDGTVISGLGLTKALNLFWAAENVLTVTSQFSDLGTALTTQCRLKIGSDLFEPNLDGASIVSSVNLSSTDCDQVDYITSWAGLSRDLADICSFDPTTAPTNRPDGLFCNVAYPEYIGDGYCDHLDTGGDYNTAGCDYDGGDCCEESCVDGDYECGVVGYYCMDPAYADANTTAFPTFQPTPTPAPSVSASPIAQSPVPASCDVLNPEWVGDGYCDSVSGGYNTPGCDFDGGDCCEETCEESASYECGVAGYFCIDPEYRNNSTSAPVVAPTPSPFSFPTPAPASNSNSSSTCSVSNSGWIGDGYCDSVSGGYNTAGCDYDGGDCCEETCQDSDFNCGVVGYHCIDPVYSNMTSSPTYAPTPTPAPSVAVSLPPVSASCNVPSPSYIGDGYCDSYGDYNTAACGYDGGDCCEETCQDSDFNCGVVGYHCVNPDYSEWTNTPTPSGSGTHYPSSSSPGPTRDPYEREVFKKYQKRLSKWGKRVEKGGAPTDNELDHIEGPAMQKMHRKIKRKVHKRHDNDA